MSTPIDRSLNSALNSAVLNFVIRMVVPMRREFGRSLDVQQFMRDAAYAQAVLEQARTSRDQRLLDYADYVSRHLGGARDVDAPLGSAESAKPPLPLAATAGPGVSGVASSAGSASSATSAGEATSATEAEMRAQMLRKYTSGLR